MPATFPPHHLVAGRTGLLRQTPDGVTVMTKQAPSTPPSKASRLAGYGERQRGFTLVELVVIITILAIAAGSLLPVVTRPYVTERRLETIREMQEIETGIAGNPDKGDYGFLGTIGRLPGVPPPGLFGSGYPQMLELIAPPTTGLETLTWAPALPVNAPPGLAYGWNGPYVRSQFRDPVNDAWNTPYTVNLNPADNTQYQIVSNGPDKAFGTSDDIVFPGGGVGAPATQHYYYSAGSVYLDIWGVTGPYEQALVYGAAGNGSDITAVQIWYPNGSGTPNGIPTFATCLPINNNSTRYQCPGNLTTPPSIPFGMHTVQITLNNWNGKFPTGWYGSPQTYYANVLVNRVTTYARVTIPLAAANQSAPGGQDPNALLVGYPGSSYLPYTGGMAYQSAVGTATNTPLTETAPASGQVLFAGEPSGQLVVNASQMVQSSTRVQLTVTGEWTLPSNPNLGCVLWVESSSAPTTGFAPVPPALSSALQTTLNTDSTTASSTKTATTGGQIWLLPNSAGEPGTTVPFTLQYQSTLPPVSVTVTGSGSVYYQIWFAAAGGVGSGSCTLASATASLLQTPTAATNGTFP